MSYITYICPYAYPHPRKNDLKFECHVLFYITRQACCNSPLLSVFSSKRFLYCVWFLVKGQRGFLSDVSVWT